MSRGVREVIPSPHFDQHSGTEIVFTFKFIKAKQISVNIDIYDWGDYWDAHLSATGKLFSAFYKTLAFYIPLLISSRLCPQVPAEIFQSFLFENNFFCQGKTSKSIFHKLLKWHQNVWDCFMETSLR